MKYLSSPSLNSFLRVTILRFLVLTLFTAAFSSYTFADPSDDVQKMIKRAGKLLRAGSMDAAEVVLREALKIDGNRSATKVELAYVLVKSRKLVEAYELAYAVAKAEPNNARAFAVLGAVLLNAGRFKEARAFFFNSIKLDKHEDLAWAGYGLLDFYENRIDESLSNLSEAVYQKPDEPDYLFALAQVSARSERYRDAADAYNRFLSVSSNTDKERRERIKGLINFLRFLGQRESLYRPVGKDETKVGFDLVGDRPVIKMRINGQKEPLRFVLDTGSGISVISQATAKLLKVKEITRGGYAKGIGGNGKFEIIYGFLRQVDIGDVTVRNVPIYIREFRGNPREVDGYIGLALISKFLTTLDYGARTFALTRKDSDQTDLIASNSLSLPLRLTSSGFLSGEVQLEGIEAPLNFIVDTGASISVISDRVAKTGKMSDFANDERLRVIGSAGITEDVPTFLLPRVSFGNYSRTSIMAVALNLDVINEASGFEQAGILGGNFLKNYRLTFDFKNSKVTFTSLTPEKE